MFSVASVCHFVHRGRAKMWPLPMMHWTSLYSPIDIRHGASSPGPGPLDIRHGTLLSPGPAPAPTPGEGGLCTVMSYVQCLGLRRFPVQWGSMSRLDQGQGQWSLDSEVQCPEGTGTRAEWWSCTVRSNASWVMATPPPVGRMADKHDWKHYLPATSLAGGNDRM